MEIAALAVSMPWAAGMRIRSTESAGSTWVIAGPTRTAGATGVITGAARTTKSAGVIAWAAGPTGTARAAGVTRSTRTTGATGVITGATWAAWAAGAARIVGASGCVAATRRRPTMITRRLRRPGSSVGKPGAHPQGCGAERAGDGHPSDKLLQLHDASPIHQGFLARKFLEAPPVTTSTLDSLPMGWLWPTHVNL
jgi:hypothetical protein